jgi:hypothetical protein
MKDESGPDAPSVSSLILHPSSFVPPGEGVGMIAKIAIII